jgi:iron(III) transport system substrate-binding protein
MRTINLLLAVLMLVVATSALSASDTTIRVLTDRTESHLEPLFKHFEKTTGIAVEAVYVDKGLMARLQAQPTEADLVITKTAANLERARLEGLTQPINSSIVDALETRFVDPDKAYVITSYRPRGFFFSKERPLGGTIESYMDITKPELKGRVVVRSGYHDYNMSLFTQMMESEGPEYTKAFITGLHANLARTPKSNDRGQVRAIFDGEADISVGNSYYQGIMMSRDDQRPWAESATVFFPDQKGKGAYVMQSAAGLTTATRNVDGATKFLEYMVGDFAQFYLANALHVYSILPDLPISAFNSTLGADQPEVVDGRFKVNAVSIRAIDQHREAVIAILNELNFDSK